MQKKLLTSGNIFKRTDDRWGGTVWYSDKQGGRKRKSFSGTSKQKVKEKITAYIANFNQALEASDEARQTLQVSMDRWLRVFKFPSPRVSTCKPLCAVLQEKAAPVPPSQSKTTVSGLCGPLSATANQSAVCTTIYKDRVNRLQLSQFLFQLFV